MIIVPQWNKITVDLEISFEITATREIHKNNQVNTRSDQYEFIYLQYSPKIQKLWFYQAYCWWPLSISTAYYFFPVVRQPTLSCNYI